MHRFRCASLTLSYTTSYLMQQQQEPDVGGGSIWGSASWCVWKGGFWGLVVMRWDAWHRPPPSHRAYISVFILLNFSPSSHIPTLHFFSSFPRQFSVHSTCSLPPPAVLPAVRRPELAACVLILLFCSSKLMNQWLQVVLVPSPCSS